jgi:two-component system, NtrC family, sensor kinase
MASLTTSLPRLLWAGWAGPIALGVNRWAALASLLVALLAATLAFVLRLNRGHARLRDSLETQLVERRRAEEALRASEVFYHSLVESLPQNILRKDREGRFTFGNRRFCDIVGRPLEQIIGRTDLDFFPRELAEKYRADDARVMETRAIMDVVEEHVTPDGQVHYVQVLKTPLINESTGEVIGIQGIFWDVTESRRVQEELRQSRERFELAVQGSKDGIWDWNIRTGEVFYSPRWKAQLGYEDHEVPNQFEEWEGRLHPDDRERTLSTVRKYLDGELADYQVEHRLRHKDGSYRWILTRGVAYRDPDGKPYRMAGSHTDITARKRAEQQLFEQNQRLQELALSERLALEELKQAQSRMVETAKLAGLGQMVAGVAHEINNPLSYVSNNVAVLQRDLGDLAELLALYRRADGLIAAHDPDLSRQIRELCDRVDMDYTLANMPALLNRTRDGLVRIQQIVKDLRVFARLDQSDLNEVDLNAGIESTATIVLGHAKKKQVKVELDLAPLPPVTCYPAKINQVIMNLVSNAIDACDEGGTVTLRTRPEGGGVRIEVQDDGCGIDPAVRERIFEPFFTTKPVGIGTGLGLSISYGIVQDHGGRIDFDSQPGRGTRFVVHLPLRPPRKGGTPAPQVAGAAATPAEGLS